MSGFLGPYYAWADKVGIQLLEWASDAKFYDQSGKASFPRPTKVSQRGKLAEKSKAGTD